MEPAVSIVLLNWNTGDETIECLKSLYNIEYDNFEIIIVDNNSHDDSVEKIKEYAAGERTVSSPYVPDDFTATPIDIESFEIDEAMSQSRIETDLLDRKLTLIENDTNAGFPGGCNIGMNYAMKKDVDYVLLLNNDVVVDKEFLTHLVEPAEVDSSVGIVGSKIYYYDDPDRIQSIGGDMRWWIATPIDYGSNEADTGEYDEIKERDFVWATSQLIKTNLIEEIGGLDETFFFGVEEYDYCSRAKNAGYKVLFSPESKIWHKGNASGKKLSEYPNVAETINSKKGFLDYKFIYALLRKRFPPGIVMIPFVLRYVSVVFRGIRHRVGTERSNRENI
jgi:GT2 family glycosyltransferase